MGRIRVVEGSFTYGEAHAQCGQAGGRLLEVRNQAQADAALQVLQGVGGGRKYYVGAEVDYTNNFDHSWKWMESGAHFWNDGPVAGEWISMWPDRAPWNGAYARDHPYWDCLYAMINPFGVEGVLVGTNKIKVELQEANCRIDTYGAICEGLPEITASPPPVPPSGGLTRDITGTGGVVNSPPPPPPIVSGRRRELQTPSAYSYAPGGTTRTEVADAGITTQGFASLNREGVVSPEDEMTHRIPYHELWIRSDTLFRTTRPRLPRSPSI